MHEKDSVIKEQTTYRNLRKQYAELDHIQEMECDQKYWSKELQFLNDYIRYKGLDEEYQYFRQNAHEERNENLPFAFYTL